MAINKMFVMLPVMLAARKLDAEDPNIVMMLRVSYFGVQFIILCLVGFMYLKAQGITDKTVIYVPPPPQPFEGPDAKKKYTQAEYAAHVQKAVISLVGSTLFGVCMTSGLHFYKGMVVGLAIQSVMGPFSMFESPLFKLFFLGEKHVFGEKKREELESDAEIVDAQGNNIQLGAAPAIKAKKDEKTSNGQAKQLEDVILDTWDDGERAVLGPLMEALNKSNINYQTKTDGNKWTPLMVVCGLGTGVKGVTSALKQMKALGAEATMVDSEGWNALHWTAFHGSAEAAKFLLRTKEEGGYDGINLGLHLVKDKEGKTAMEHAIAEKNDDVAEVISAALGEADKATSKEDEGLRKRK